MASFAPAPPVVDIPLSLFSGMDPELNPVDVPEGLSPDNQDMIYLPGSTESRPGLNTLLIAPLAGTPTITYEKSFQAPDGTVSTLILDSNGVLWVENVASGAVTQLDTVTPGLSGQSVTAFGREYIAVSDLLHGADIPRQWDGTNLDRVTQDGPGAAPAAADLVLVYNLLASPNGIVPNTFSTAIASISEVGNLVTLITNPLFASIPLKVGDFITITGYGGGATAYNGLYQISFVSLDQRTIQYVNPTAGLPPTAGGGTIAIVIVDFVLSASPVGQSVGSPFTIAGAGVAGYNGTYTARAIFLLTNTVRATIAASLGASGNGTFTVGGTISAGVHQVVYMFLTRSGYLTKPSPAFLWAAGGGKKAMITGLATGPSNVIARVLAFTGAGGDNFFSILANINLPNPTGGPNIVIQSTIVPDNTSTSVLVDFTDDALFAANAIDIVGNNLFDQAVLGPVLGFFAYDSRLFAWGEYNKIQNFVNMGFDGGVLGALGASLPPGWNATGSSGGSGSVVNAPVSEFGFAYSMVSAGGLLDGLLQQSAYEDEAGGAILQPDTNYMVRFKAQRSVHSIPIAGSLNIELFSPTAGSIAKLVLLAAGLSTSPNPQWISGPLLGTTPVTIPQDVVLRIYFSGVNAGISALIDELMVIDADQPYLNNEAKASYVNNPEAFALTTGGIGPADDPSPIRCFSLQRNTVLLKTGEGTHQFQSSDFEPYQWSVNQLSRSVGALSLRAGDPGKFGTGDAAEDWDFTFTPNGMYLFAGGDFWKTSQEMQPVIDQINFAAMHTIWVKNDINTRRAYIGVPTGTATAPNLILVMDYRELDTASQIASSPPVHISLSGKMVCSDLTRKWTRWNIQANTAEILLRSGNDKEFVLGGGNGMTPGMLPGFGNLYFLDFAKLTDDDYGQITPYYTTYFFINHEQEQALGIGSHRKLMKKVCAFATGTGNVFFTPLVDSLFNPLPNSSLRRLIANTSVPTALTQDLEWVTGIRGERIALKWQVAPLPGQTDVKLSLQKLIVTMAQDPIQVTRTSRL